MTITIWDFNSYTVKNDGLVLSFDGKPSPDNPVGVPIRQPDTPASQANPRTPTLLISASLVRRSRNLLQCKQNKTK